MIKKAFYYLFAPIFKKILKLIEVDLVILDKSRFGKPNDGGYVIFAEAAKQTRTLLCFGVGSDVSFEREFAEMAQQCKVYCFDPTVVCLPGSINNSSFYKIGLSASSGGDYKSMGDVIKMINAPYPDKASTFLKMDIEGYEWDVFEDKNAYDIIRNIDQIAIELHFKCLTSGSRYRLPLEIIKRYKIIKKIKKDFFIINLHANNASGQDSYTTYRKFIFPNLVELSLINKKIVRKLAVDLNQPCEPTMPDIQSFWR